MLGEQTILGSADTIVDTETVGLIFEFVYRILCASGTGLHSKLELGVSIAEGTKETERREYRALSEGL